MRARYLTLSLIALISLSYSAFAAGPIATAGASRAFLLGGVTVPETAANAVPVVAGDEISALDSPVQLTFADNSSFRLDRKSTVRVQDGQVRVIKGSVQYQLAPKSKVSVLAGQTVLRPRSGVATVGSNTAPVLTPVLSRPILNAAPPKRSKQCPHSDNPDDHDCGNQ